MRTNHGSTAPPLPPEAVAVPVPVPEEDEVPVDVPLDGGVGFAAEAADNATVMTEPSAAILRKAPFPVSAT